MRFAVDSPHREYYHKEGAIEFDGIVSDSLLKELQKGVFPASPPAPFPKKEEHHIWEQGRDLWRRSAPFKRLTHQKNLAQIAADLNEKKIIRLGFDQFLTETHPFPAEPVFSLAETSSIQGVVCGLILCLRAPTEALTPTKLFSAKEGSGVYFLPSTPLNFKELAERPRGEYLLIVYTEPNAVYIYQEQDPLTHVFKQLGYVYGDKLSDKIHPKVLK